MSKLWSFLTDKNFYTNFNQNFEKIILSTFVSYLTDEISKGFDSGLLTGRILIDLQKAFDIIDNKLLLKIPSLGFPHKVVD